VARHVPQYGVFIIESMDWKNERNGKLSGFALKTILELSDIPNEYYYIRTKVELKKVMKEFKKSDFFFLHLACHGDSNGLEFTIDYLDFNVLGEIMGPYLKYRRLFLSACNAACPAFAEQFVPRHHCYSVIGSPDTIDYDKAAILWSSFYYLMYINDQKHMYQKNLIPTIENVTRLFQEPINYYSIIKDTAEKSKTHLQEIHFKNGDRIVSRSVKTRFKNLYWNERFD
jgi:hypothetical protein